MQHCRDCDIGDTRHARLIDDLRASVAYAKKAAGTEAKSSALYGLSGSAEGNKMVTDLMLGMFDLLYEV